MRLRVGQGTEGVVDAVEPHCAWTIGAALIVPSASMSGVSRTSSGLQPTTMREDSGALVTMPSSMPARTGGYWTVEHFTWATCWIC